MSPLETYLEELYAIRSSGGAVEETSYYPALSNLLNEVGKTLKLRVRCIINIQNAGAGLRGVTALSCGVQSGSAKVRGSFAESSRTSFPRSGFGTEKVNSNVSELIRSSPKSDPARFEYTAATLGLRRTASMGCWC